MISINHTLKIKLNSDMCCGTGEGDGKYKQVTTAVDDIGLPYIPARRLKGLLRECAEFLQTNSYITEKELTSLFGGHNGKRGRIRIGNAVLPDYVCIKDELSSLDDSLTGIITKSAITQEFTSLRTQTAIRCEGVVLDNLLRTTETIRKGIVFYAELQVSDESPKDTDILLKCAKLLRQIGLNKTRGFGEVECELITESENVTVKALEYRPTEKVITVQYRLTLLDDMTISRNSNQAISFISGSMLLGAFARFCGTYDWFKEAILQRTIFSNAYISNEETITYPTPSTMKCVKNQSSEVINSADTDSLDSNRQYVPYGGYSAVVGDRIIKIPVLTAHEFHYSPKQNLIYSFTKLLKNQTFCGDITADEGILELLEGIVDQNNGYIFLGGSVSAQYSKCKFEFRKSELQHSMIEVNETMIIELLSDIIIVDNYGNNTADPKYLERELSSILCFKKCEAYTHTCIIGGYNAQWGLPKRQFIAFAKGGVLKLTGCGRTKLPEQGYIGLFHNEGFGHYRIRHEQKAEFIPQALDIRSSQLDYHHITDQTKHLINKILLSHILENAKEFGISKANTHYDKSLSSSAAMRFLAAYKQVSVNKGDEFPLYDRLSSFININFDRNEILLKLSKKALDEYKNYMVKVTDMFNSLNITQGTTLLQQNADNIFGTYILSFISQIKRNYQKEDVQS